MTATATVGTYVTGTTTLTPAGEATNSGLGDYLEILNMQARASKRSIRRFVITEKAPTRAFSWLKAASTTFTFKTLC